MIDKYLKALNSKHEMIRQEALMNIIDVMIENDWILTLNGNVWDVMPREDFDPENAENAWEIRNGHFVAYAF